MNIGLTTILLYFISINLAFPQLLPDTQPLDVEGDFAARMVDGIDRYLMRAIDQAAQNRDQHWQRSYTSLPDYLRSIKPNRQRFKEIIGVVDPRDPTITLQFTAPVPTSNLNQNTALIASGKNYKVYSIRWNVFRGITGEGLLLEPDHAPSAAIVALPDCDWTPEMLVGLQKGVALESQFARKLAENGCRVIIPTLIDRKDTHSGIPGIRMTNQPHREFLWRAAYEMGRHIIGYEVQKITSLVDCYKEQNAEIPIGVIGYGEGALLAFYAAAIDERIDAAAISGYFNKRENLWQEPIYRSIWSLLKEFGDAEIASLVFPRALIIEHTQFPKVDGPPQTKDRRGAAPGKITTPNYEIPLHEYHWFAKIPQKLAHNGNFSIFNKLNDHPATDDFLIAFLQSLNINAHPVFSDNLPELSGARPNARKRLERQFHEILEDTQYLMRESEFTRQRFWSKADDSSVQSWEESTEWYREYFWDEIIGRLPIPTLPLNPRTKLIYDQPKYKGYQVMLDVYPDVFAYGILLVPKDIQAGEQRPVVVCQHGLEGRPEHVADPEIDHRAYHNFANKLAERGFVTFAPQNPYIGEDRFRVLQRKAQPLKLSLFSFIVRQHERILQWLSQQPFVDPNRIGFYGLSYGGKTAMRVPALLKNYALSICSADYNEWIWKNVSAHHRYSYLITGEYEMPEFNLGNTFNYAEMSWLIFPRPFMVERGHNDGVAPDQWVAYEYARTRKLYDELGLGHRTEIEFFNGPHMINGIGTFDFLHKHLHWPME